MSYHAINQSVNFYIVDAFTQRPFGGNPAAVCPLDNWLPDEVMQQMAAQHNLSETAFFVASEKEGVDYHIRWFTPTTEVDLCGHATLASCFIMFNQLGCVESKLVLDCQVGLLHISKDDDGKIYMDFPANAPVPHGLLGTFGSICGARPQAVFTGSNAQPDLVLVFEEETQVRDTIPNFLAIRTLPQYRAIIATAPAEDPALDFICRVFAPSVGIDEDPVTGSAYTLLAPIWADKLDKTKFAAKQLSSRGGDVWCTLENNENDARVVVAGFARLYAQGQLTLA